MCRSRQPGMFVPEQPDVPATIAELPDTDPSTADRVHPVVTADAPVLEPASP